MAFTPRTETYVNVSSLTTPFDITVTKPTGTVNGDLLFCWIGWYAAVTIDSVPSGWNLLGEYLANTDRYALYYKIASGEGASWVWSFTATAKVRAVCSCYTAGNFNGATPIDVVSNTAYRTSDLNVIAATMNVAAASSPLIFWGGFYSTTTKSFTKPSVPTSGWLEDDDVWNTTPDFGTEVCSFIWTGSGATGAMSATLSTGSITTKHAFAVALKPAPVVEGTSSGSGNGLATSTSSLYVLGISAISGSGSASSTGTLDVLAQVSGSGVGLSSSLALIYVLAQVQGSGSGFASADGDAILPIIEGVASGAGIGLGSSQGILDVLAQVVGSGIGLSSGTAYLIIPASVLGSGAGGGSANNYLVIPATASASGTGLAAIVAQLVALAQVLGSGAGGSGANSYIIIPASALGNGAGESTLQTLLDILVSASGSGAGECEAVSYAIIPAIANASGIGLALSSAEVIELVPVEGVGTGSGVGIGSAKTILTIFGLTQATGIGEGLVSTSTGKNEKYLIRMSFPPLIFSRTPRIVRRQN